MKTIKLLPLLLALCMVCNSANSQDKKEGFKITSFETESIEIEDNVFINKLITSHNGKKRKVDLKYSVVDGKAEIKKYGNYDIVTVSSPKAEVKVVATSKSDESCEATLTCYNETPVVTGFYTDSVKWKSVVVKGNAKHPAYRYVNADPSLPNVLIIGNSISIGYTPYVRDELKGVANIYRIPVNAASTETGLSNINYWLSDIEWDVIHVNWGLHDLKYVISNDHQDVPPALYKKNLKKLLTHMQNVTKAKIIWAQTTFVPSKVKPRRDMGDDKIYNDIALEVLKYFPDIAIDDHYKLTSENQDLQLPHNVHFTNEGYLKLGKQVAGYIREALK